MARIHETRASLRFFGDDLEPENISALLGHPPTTGRVKGETWLTKSGREKIARTGSWILEAASKQPGDLDAQIAELLDGLNHNPEIWQNLTTRFRADIFCGIFMQESNEGISLSVQSLQDLASRKLFIDFDIYDPPSDD
jgi:hypothetical protein